MSSPRGTVSSPTSGPIAAMRLSSIRTDAGSVGGFPSPSRIFPFFSKTQRLMLGTPTPKEKTARSIYQSSRAPVHFKSLTLIYYLCSSSQGETNARRFRSALALSRAAPVQPLPVVLLEVYDPQRSRKWALFTARRRKLGRPSLPAEL